MKAFVGGCELEPLKRDLLLQKRKGGESLETFIRTRLPDMANEPTKKQQTEIEQGARGKMWWEVVNKTCLMIERAQQGME